MDDWITPVSDTQTAPSAAPKPPADDWQSVDDWGAPEAQGQFGQWSKAVTDIPSEIGKRYSGAWQGVKEGLNPIGKAEDGALWGALKTGQGLLNAAYLASGVGPAIVGTARSLIGHPMAEAEHALGCVMSPETAAIAAKDNPEEMF